MQTRPAKEKPHLATTHDQSMRGILGADSGFARDLRWRFPLAMQVRRKASKRQCITHRGSDAQGFKDGCKQSANGRFTTDTARPTSTASPWDKTCSPCITTKSTTDGSQPTASYKADLRFSSKTGSGSSNVRTATSRKDARSDAFMVCSEYRAATKTTQTCGCNS